MFTTHTPVPAGHDAFPFSVEKHLAGCWGSLGHIAIGSRLARTTSAWAGSTDGARALRSAGSVNAVSQHHGRVTRECGPMWPGVAEADRRLVITSSVHVPTGSPRISRTCYASTSAPAGSIGRTAGFWTPCSRFPDAELWAVRQGLRKYLFTFVRDRARQRWTESASARRASRRRHAARTGNATASPAGFRLQAARRSSTSRRLARIWAPDGATGDLSAERLRAASARIFGACAKTLDPFSGTQIRERRYHVALYSCGAATWLNNPRKRSKKRDSERIKAALNGVRTGIGDGWWAERLQRLQRLDDRRRRRGTVSTPSTPRTRTRSTCWKKVVPAF